MQAQTQWKLVAALLAAGVIVALQIGKAVIAVPVVQKELAMSLTLASWVIGAYGLLGAIVGLPAGIVISLFPGKRALIAGLLCCGTGSLAGAFAKNGETLIATRALEGCGFLIAVIAIPRLLRIVTGPRDSGPVLAVWSAYMPAGSLIMILVGPYLMRYGWQAMWLVNAAIVFGCAAVIAILHFREPPAGSRNTGAILENIRDAVAAPGPLLLSLIFGIYTFQYAAMVGLLPVLVVDRMGRSVAEAGALGALAVAGNVLGNLSAGVLVRLGVPIWVPAIAGFVFVGFAGYGVFGGVLPAAGAALLAAASLVMTGLIPSSAYAAAPGLSRDSVVLAITLGLLTQASNVGNVLGPAAMASVIERAGWAYAPYVFAAIAVAGVSATLMFRAVAKRRATAP
jgi:predicted MFS family arabinose efflux permease